jgi:hypothetical protein
LGGEVIGPWYLYLDESGDLGFDWSKKGTSRYFTICILAVRTATRNKTLSNAVKKTLRRKFNYHGADKKHVVELKGARTSLEVRTYFFNQVAGVRFGVYALTLNKSRLYPELATQKERTYNYLARLILDQIPFEAADTSVELVLDRRKNKTQVADFNGYVEAQLHSRLSPTVPLYIRHQDSQSNYCLQAVDLFSYGVFRKYERGDDSWLRVFRGKVQYDDVFLP